jgi:hypothetical protein
MELSFSRLFFTYPRYLTVPQDLVKLFKVASPQLVYPASPITSCGNYKKKKKSLAHVFPHLCIFTDPDASLCGTLPGGMSSPLGNCE